MKDPFDANKLIKIASIQEVHRRNAEFRENRIRAQEAIQLENDVSRQKAKLLSV